VGGRTHVVHGPWQVVIKGVGAYQGRAVVARWEIYRSWIAEETAETAGSEVREYAIPGSSEKLLMGASERRWRYASEMRLGGASEVFFLGASEFRARGASERLFMGASQYKMSGASETPIRARANCACAGASERLLGGASELRLGGSSERFWAGAAKPAGRRPGGKRRAAGPRAGHYPSPDSMGSRPDDKE
jgi:hypothetical protein